MRLCYLSLSLFLQRIFSLPLIVLYLFLLGTCFSYVNAADKNKYISMSLFAPESGKCTEEDSKYTKGIKNWIFGLNTRFPGWTLRIYHDTAVISHVKKLQQFADERGASVEFLNFETMPGISVSHMRKGFGYIARYAVFSDEKVKFAAIRDADSSPSKTDFQNLEVLASSEDGVFHYYGFRYYKSKHVLEYENLAKVFQGGEAFDPEIGKMPVILAGLCSATRDLGNQIYNYMSSEILSGGDYQFNGIHGIDEHLLASFFTKIGVESIPMKVQLLPGSLRALMWTWAIYAHGFKGCFEEGLVKKINSEWNLSIEEQTCLISILKESGCSRDRSILVNSSYFDFRIHPPSISEIEEKTAFLVKPLQKFLEENSRAGWPLMTESLSL